MSASLSPGLGLVQEFVNTNDVEGGDDDFAEPAALRAWLVARDLAAPGDDFSAADLRRALDFREALRALLVANNGGQLDPDALASLNLTARSAPVLVHFDAGGSTRLESDARGIDGALGRILGSVHAAMADGTWARLKACAKHSCRWAFYDTSKNRSRTWCSMKVCGNRVKARKYRERQKL
jgi:predicted RNA-binding Zn ribbon-like protein